MTLKDELSRSVGAQYATGKEWRNNSRKNEVAVFSVVSDSVQPQRWQPTRLLCPWDSPGKNEEMERKSKNNASCGCDW